MTHQRRILTAALCAALSLGTPAVAGDEPKTLTSAQANPFSALVGKKRERRQSPAARVSIERYVLASDDRAFLFEDRSNEARVKFLCGADDPRLECVIDARGSAAEIYILAPTRGPRGDMIYKNAEGDVFLRIASYGGATVFWPGDAQGRAASKSFGDNEFLALSFTEYETAVRRAQAATAIVSAMTGAPIIFDLGAPPKAEGTNAAVLADAVVMAAKGVKEVAEDPTGARIIASRIGKIAFLADQAASVSLNGVVLEIRYVPIGDVDARPSSAAVARFLEETL